MGIQDKVASFLGPTVTAAAGNSFQQMKAFARQTGLNPVMQTAGADIAGKGSSVLQSGANILADVGDAAAKKSALLGQVTSPFVAASNLMHSGSQAFGNLGPRAQTALGYGALGAGTIAAGAAAGAVAQAGINKRKERMAGQNLGAQLGVGMPPQY